MSLPMETNGHALEYDDNAAYRNALMPASWGAEHPMMRPGVHPDSVSFGHVKYVGAVLGVEASPVTALATNRPEELVAAAHELGLSAAALAGIVAYTP